MDMPTPKKPNGLPTPLTTNVATMTIVKTGAKTITMAAVTTKTTATTTIVAKMIASPSVTTARIAREADKAIVAGLITPTPSMLMPSAPTMLILASC